MTDLWVDSEEGLVSELRAHGLAPPLEVVPKPQKPKLKLPEVELDDVQRKAVENLGHGKILVGGTGVGKSRTAAAWYMARESHRDVIVITTAKKRDSFDWEEEFNRFGVSTDGDLSIAGKLTVDSWNNIGRYEEVENAVFIFDEQRLVGAGSWTASFLKIARSNRWILLSATPGDTWLDYIPVFVANGFYRNRTEFKREHVVYARFAKFPKVDRYLGEDKLLRLRHSIQVEMPYTPHTTRHTKYVPVEYDKELLHQAMVQRWHVYEERPIRDVAELFLVMRKIVNSDPSRTEAVKCLMQKHPKLIVFYNFNYELEMLRELGRLASEAGLKNSQSSISSTTKESYFHDGSTTEASKKASSEYKEDEWQSDSSTRTMRDSSLTHPSFSSDTSSPQSSCMAGDTSSSDTTSTPLERTGSRRLQKTPSSGQNAESFAVAEWNGQKHEPIPKTDSWLYLVQYTAGAEGWNCTETDSMAFWSLTYSYKSFHQAYGRTDRRNTPFKDLNYYVLKSASPIDGAIMQALKDKKNFNEASMGIKF